MSKILRKVLLVFSIFFFLKSYHVNADYSLSDGTYCDGSGWVPYKDEKCYKLIQNWTTRDVANNSCAQEWLQTDSTVPQLVTIKSADEQDFLTKWVFVEEEVMINVWIGAKRLTNSNEFVWDDGSAVEFTNWADDSPSDEAKSACVVMQSKYVKNQAETNKELRRVNGKWRDVFCEQPNYLICEKLPRWSFQKVQQTLLEQRKELVSTKNELSNLKQNTIPLGFIYAQLPNEISPTEIWPWMAWTDVSDAYAGLFFRVNGGGSEAFGTIQAENSPRVLRMVTYADYGDNQLHVNHNVTVNEQTVGQTQIETSQVHTGDFHLSGHLGLRLVKSDGEVRPRNMAFRVWKRTG